MAWNGETVLAVVPARGGSKGIPRKNLRAVGGRSLIAWTGETIRQLDWIDAAVLSTDDEEMAEEGRRSGLEVPFMRPDELATDLADSVGMWRHAWLESEARHEKTFDLSILLQPTTPLRRAEDVERTVRAMVEGGHKAAATVTPLPGHYAPEKLLRAGPGGVLDFYLGEEGRRARRQDAGAYQVRNGICYAVRRETLVDDGNIVEDDCVGVVIDDFIVNIDEPIELELAEFMLRRDREADTGSRDR